MKSVESSVVHNRRPVLVFAGSFWAGSTEHGLADGFRSEGCVVQEINKDSYLPISRGLPDRLYHRISRGSRAALYNEAILNACRGLQPDFLLTVKGSHISQTTVKSASDYGIRTVFYWPDVHFDHPGVDLNAVLTADLFVTSKTFHIPWLAGKGLETRSAFVAHGYDPAAHRPIFRHVSESDYTADIRYIGTRSPAKQAWIEKLHRALPDASLRVIGNRWETGLNRQLAKRLLEPGHFVAAQYALAIQTAKINVAVHMGKASNGWEDLVSTRTFEIPACGGFMLHIDNDEVREYYDVGSEIDVFSDTEELAEKCRFYLANDNIRRKMVQRAYERCVPAYSYHSRAKAILNVLCK